MMMMNGETMYYNIICEEIGVTGGKMVYVDENRGTLEEIHEIVNIYSKKHPNAKWEMYPMTIYVPMNK
jgi:hypothetical protein